MTYSRRCSQRISVCVCWLSVRLIRGRFDLTRGSDGRNDGTSFIQHALVANAMEQYSFCCAADRPVWWVRACGDNQLIMCAIWRREWRKVLEWPPRLCWYRNSFGVASPADSAQPPSTHNRMLCHGRLRVKWKLSIILLRRMCFWIHLHSKIASKLHEFRFSPSKLCEMWNELDEPRHTMRFAHSHTHIKKFFQSNEPLKYFIITEGIFVWLLEIQSIGCSVDATQRASGIDSCDLN